MMLYIKRTTFLLLLLISISQSFAKNIDLSAYKSVQNIEKLPYLPNMDFSAKAKGWTVGKNYFWEPGIGINGTGGLKYVNSDPRMKSRTTRRFHLKAGNTYRITFHVKILKTAVLKDGHIPKTFRPGYLEFTKGSGKKNYLGWMSTGRIKNDPDIGWQTSQTEFTVPAGAKYTIFSLWLHNQGSTGEAVFDHVNISPAGTGSTAYMVCPAYNTIKPKKDTIRIRIFTDSQKEIKNIEANDAVINIKINGGTTQFAGKVKNGFLDFTTGKLPLGKGILGVAIVDHGKKLKYSSYSIPVQVRKLTDSPYGVVTIDKYNRTWVDGKLFMPMGVYISSGYLKKTVGWDFAEEVKIISKSPFNTILDYHSHGWHRRGKNNYADMCHKNNIKFIINLGHYDEPETKSKVRKEQAQKLVGIYRKHPGLLCYYLSDELPMAKLPLINARRVWVNFADPFHPTYLAHHVKLDMPYYGTGADIIGCDFYPLRNKDVKIRDISKVMEDAKRTQQTGKLCWNVPQIYSQGIHRDKGEKYHEYIEPSIEEMRAMFLLMANYGSRGFIAYARSSLYRHSEARKNYEKRWKDICKVAKDVVEQKSFIMSELGPANVPVKVKSGKVDAKVFTNENGEKRVFIVSCTSESSEAEIVIESDKKLKSKYGFTSYIGDNKYIFKSTGVNSDILL